MESGLPNPHSRAICCNPPPTSSSRRRAASTRNTLDKVGRGPPHIAAKNSTEVPHAHVDLCCQRLNGEVISQVPLASGVLWVWVGVQAGRRELPRASESETGIRWREPLVAPCDGYRKRGLHALPKPASSFPWTWERAWGDEGCARIFGRTRDW